MCIYQFLKKVMGAKPIYVILNFFITITATELLISSLSMPLLFFKESLTGSVLLTICILVAYKVVANMLMTIGYGFYVSIYKK
jgi:hypothetical protein